MPYRTCWYLYQFLAVLTLKIKTFILQTDASSYCVGAVLSQTDWEGLDHPVGYFSRTLLDRAEILHNCERMFSHQASCQDISMHLLGWCLIIQKDHRTLQWLSNDVKDENSHLARRSLAQQPTNLKLNTEKEEQMQIQIFTREAFPQRNCCTQ